MTKKELAYALGISRKTLKKLATTGSGNGLPHLSFWDWERRKENGWSIELSPHTIRVMAKARRKREHANT